MPETVYSKVAATEMERMMSLLNREFCSRTAGAFDRLWWGWKFIDFPGARFQEGICSLSFLYSYDFEGNYLYGNERVVDWIHRALKFYSSIQYADYSYDEAYPFERSLAAVAFTVFYISEGLELVKDKLDAKALAAAKLTLSRAGLWLCKNDESHGFLSNHLAAAAAACDSAGRFVDDEKIMSRRDYFLRRIYSKQSPEGWMSEYGGADPGYQTHGAIYLSRIWERGRDKELLERLKRANKFQTYFIHSNGTFGGEYGSRNTKFYFPCGYEVLSEADESANAIASYMRGKIESRSAIGMSAMDPHNFFPMLNSYLFAHRAAIEKKPPAPAPKLPVEDGQDRKLDFPDAGLRVIFSGDRHIVISARKGGVVKAYDRSEGRLLASDCGYTMEIGKKLYSSQHDSPEAKAVFEDGSVICEHSFKKVDQSVFSPFMFMAFRIVMLTAGRIPRVALFIKSLLVKVLISKADENSTKLRRRISFDGISLEIADELAAARKIELPNGIYRGPMFATIHMGSSRYFHPEETQLEKEEIVCPAGAVLNPGAPIKIKKILFQER